MLKSLLYCQDTYQLSSDSLSSHPTSGRQLGNSPIMKSPHRRVEEVVRVEIVSIGGHHILTALAAMDLEGAKERRKAGRKEGNQEGRQVGKKERRKKDR